MYYLNLYFTVVKDELGIYFAQLEMETKQNNRIQFDNKQEFVFGELIEGKGIGQKFAEEMFGEETIELWIQQQILLRHPIDLTGIYSRSKAYYWGNQCGDAVSVLNNKKVLILGCGGIGTHVGWNLTTLGVGEIDFIDHDVVELSNLNRQAIYDQTDIGKKKVEVLKEKLQRVNSNIQIGAQCWKIDSEKELEVLCVGKKYDLIIKSLDSPLEFSNWLDNVCKKNNLKYITAIIMDSYLAVGPTYIPGETMTYNEILGTHVKRERIAGIGPSLGFMMYEIGGKVSQEAFKLLTGKGELKYKNIIEYTDCMNNTVFRMIGKGKKEIWDKAVLVNALILMFIFYLGSCYPTYRIFSNAFAIIYSLVVPVVIADQKITLHRLGCISLLIVQLLNLIYIIPYIRSQRAWSLYSLTVFITSLFLMVSILLLLFSMVQAGMWNIKQKRGSS